MIPSLTNWDPQKPRVYQEHGSRHLVFDVGGDSIYLGPQETKVLPRPVTSLTGGRGWTSSTSGHLHTVPSFCRAHGDVTHGGPGILFCELSVFLPTDLYAF